MKEIQIELIPLKSLNRTVGPFPKKKQFNNLKKVGKERKLTLTSIKGMFHSVTKVYACPFTIENCTKITAMEFKRCLK